VLFDFAEAVGQDYLFRLKPSGKAGLGRRFAAIHGMATAIA
jgi:hypothetical protein